jgi:putative flippase GtrA
MQMPKALTVEKGLPGYRAFLRSVAVSAVSFALDFFLCMLLVEKGRLGYLPATALSFVAGTVLNYFLSSLLVFGKGHIDSRGLEFLAFLGIAGIGLLLNALDMYIFTSLAGIHYLISRVISGSLVFFFNYACRKFLVFADLGSNIAGFFRNLGWHQNHGRKRLRDTRRPRFSR